MSRIEDRREYYRQMKGRRLSGLVHEESRARATGVILVLGIVTAWIAGMAIFIAGMMH